MFGFVGNAQRVSQEEARVQFAKTMVELVKDVSPYYKKGLSYNDFVIIISNGGTGPYNPIPTEEGNNLLKKAHDFLSKGTSSDEILRNYDGIELAKVSNLIKDTKTTFEAGTKIFGEKFMKESKYSTDLQRTAAWPPKWLVSAWNWIWDNHEEIISIICMFFNCKP